MADSSAATVMSHARAGLDNPAILPVLRDAEGRYTRAKQDMIADSLIGRAISNHVMLRQQDGARKRAGHCQRTDAETRRQRNPPGNGDL